MKELTESKANKKPASAAAAAAPKLSAAEIRMKELAEAGAKGAPAKGKQSFFGASSSSKTSASVCLHVLPLCGYARFDTLFWPLRLGRHIHNLHFLVQKNKGSKDKAKAKEEVEEVDEDDDEDTRFKKKEVRNPSS